MFPLKSQQKTRYMQSRELEPKTRELDDLSSLVLELETATTRSSTSLEDVDQFLKNHGPDRWFEEALKLSQLKDNATAVTYLTTYGNVFILDHPHRQKIFNRCLIYGVKNNCIVTITLMADACSVEIINDALNEALVTPNRDRIIGLLQAKINSIIKGTNYAVSHEHHRLSVCSRNPNVSCSPVLMFTVQKPVDISSINPLYPTKS